VLPVAKPLPNMVRAERLERLLLYHVRRWKKGLPGLDVLALCIRVCSKGFVCSNCTVSELQPVVTEMPPHHDDGARRPRGRDLGADSFDIVVIARQVSPLEVDIFRVNERNRAHVRVLKLVQESIAEAGAPCLHRTEWESCQRLAFVRATSFPSGHTYGVYPPQSNASPNRGC
jgi:hypothetical protein